MNIEKFIISIIVIIFLFVVAALVFTMKHEAKLEEECLPYGELKIEEVPAKCLEYFTPKKSDTNFPPVILSI